MRTVTKNLYQYDELSDEAKKKALEKNWDINVDFDWYDGIYEDAKNIGLKITSFDLDRNRHAKGGFFEPVRFVAEKILKEHGKTCETYKTAKAFLKENGELFKTVDNFEDNDETTKEDYDKMDDLRNHLEGKEAEFLKSLLEDYAIILQKEYEYLTSREVIEDTIRVNEFEFEENGKPA